MNDDHAVPVSQRVDVNRLPKDVVALIDALRPGDELVITRAATRLPRSLPHSALLVTTSRSSAPPVQPQNNPHWSMTT